MLTFSVNGNFSSIVLDLEYYLTKKLSPLERENLGLLSLNLLAGKKLQSDEDEYDNDGYRDLESFSTSVIKNEELDNHRRHVYLLNSDEYQVHSVGISENSTVVNLADNSLELVEIEMCRNHYFSVWREMHMRAIVEFGVNLSKLLKLTISERTHTKAKLRLKAIVNELRAEALILAIAEDGLLLEMCCNFDSECKLTLEYDLSES
jgi:hypothetical protein